MVAVRVETADAVDALYDELVAKGVTMVQAPTTHAWNARTTYFSDPDMQSLGNLCVGGRPANALSRRVEVERALAEDSPRASS